MESDAVLELYNHFNDCGITVWIDGGWGVDALLGRQTREHSDLDIAVSRQDAGKLRALLESKGFREVGRADSTAYVFFMQNDSGQGVDVHVFEYDEAGNNTYGIPYPFGSLTGTGFIGGQAVNCVNPAAMFEFKTGYAPKEKDRQDVRALCDKFGFDLPEEYAEILQSP
ncbi:MAG: hypothetical protein LBR77_02045 [Lachnospiraceae bacterium]|jgi:lincosamide nucleotidyltransferase A/C/D/E|nr:hypothetical protein [Lachnospiraceae bacterium]